MVDVTVVGTVKRRQALTRGGARPGDELYVSGTIGAAAAGLQMLQARLDAQHARIIARPTVGRRPRGSAASQRYLYPEPRVRLGLLLGRNRAAIGVHGSERRPGRRACARSPRRAASARSIDADALPIDPARARGSSARGDDAVAEAMTGGDDYELLFAVRPRARGGWRPRARHGDVPLTRIGALHGRPRARRRGAAARRHAAAARGTATSDDSPDAQRSSAAGWTRCCTSTTRRSARPRRSRSACSSASRRSSASTRCSAIVVRVPAQPESRRGAARRLLEPAVDHRAVLRVRDDASARR